MAVLAGLALAAFVALAALFGAHATPASATTCTPPRAGAPGDSYETIHTADGRDRTYILHIPPSYTGSAAVPLVLNFHGLGGNGYQQMVYSAFSPLADAQGFIVVYPDGTYNEAVGGGRWNVVQAPAPDVDDVAFVAQLLDALQSRLCVDPARIFSTGMSNGGLMSVRLACSLSSRIAAVAPVTGAYYPPLFRDTDEICPDTRPVPFIAFHGTADTTVPFIGGPGIFGVYFRLPIDNTTPDNDVMQSWAAHNGCTNGRQQSPVTAHVSLVRYDGCNEGAMVQLYLVDGGDHQWPGAVDFAPPDVADEISANDLMWEFFQAHAQPPGPKATATATPIDTATPTATPRPPSLGGVAAYPDVSSRGNAGVVAGIVAAATAGAIALGSAAWWARRRVAGR